MVKRTEWNAADAAYAPSPSLFSLPRSCSCPWRCDTILSCEVVGSFCPVAPSTSRRRPSTFPPPPLPPRARICARSSRRPPAASFPRRAGASTSAPTTDVEPIAHMRRSVSRTPACAHCIQHLRPASAEGGSGKGAPADCRASLICRRTPAQASHSPSGTLHISCHRRRNSVTRLRSTSARASLPSPCGAGALDASYASLWSPAAFVNHSLAACITSRRRGWRSISTSTPISSTNRDAASLIARVLAWSSVPLARAASIAVRRAACTASLDTRVEGRASVVIALATAGHSRTPSMKARPRSEYSSLDASNSRKRLCRSTPMGLRLGRSAGPMPTALCGLLTVPGPAPHRKEPVNLATTGT